LNAIENALGATWADWLMTAITFVHHELASAAVSALCHDYKVNTQIFGNKTCRADVEIKLPVIPYSGIVVSSKAHSARKNDGAGGAI
jgi:hypothetical protein